MKKGLLKRLSAVAIGSIMTLNIGLVPITSYAVDIYPTESDYNFCTTSETYYTDANGKMATLYHNYYCNLTGTNNGLFTEVVCQEDGSYIYSNIIITAEDTVNKEELNAILGEQTDAIGVALADNQYCYNYSEDVDYDAVYAIDGVEKVEKSRILWQERWYSDATCCDGDTWFEDNGIDIDNITSAGLLMAEVVTDSNVQLTEESFENTDLEVKHVYYDSSSGQYFVYFTNIGLDSFTKFDEEAEAIEGVKDFNIPICMNESAGGTAILEEVDNNNVAVTTSVPEEQETVVTTGTTVVSSAATISTTVVEEPETEATVTANTTSAPSLSGTFNLTLDVVDIITGEHPKDLECEVYNYYTGEIISSWNTSDSEKIVLSGLEYSFNENGSSNNIYAIRITNLPEEYCFFYGKSTEYYVVAGSGLEEFANGSEVTTTVYIEDSDYDTNYCYISTSANETSETTPTTVVSTASTTVGTNGILVDNDGNVIIINGTSAVMSKSTSVTTKTTTTTTVTEVSEKEEVETVTLGDTNNDGKVDSKDAVCVLQYYAATLAGKTASIDAEVADMNGDKKIDSKDAVQILKQYAESLVKSK